MKKLTIEMPFPPSINDYKMPAKIGNFARLILTPKARGYQKDVPLLIYDGKRPTLTGRLKLTIYHTMPSNHVRDLDNYNKGILDALTKAGVWEDDEQIDILINVRCGVLPPGNVIATIEEIERLEQKVGKNGWKYYYPNQDFLDQEELDSLQGEF